MFEKLKATEEKFEDTSNRLTDPEVIGDNGLYAKLMKEYKACPLLLKSTVSTDLM